MSQRLRLNVGDVCAEALPLCHRILELLEAANTEQTFAALRMVRNCVVVEVSASLAEVEDLEDAVDRLYAMRVAERGPRPQ